MLPAILCQITLAHLLVVGHSKARHATHLNTTHEHRLGMCNLVRRQSNALQTQRQLQVMRSLFSATSLTTGTLRWWWYWTQTKHLKIPYCDQIV